MSNFEDRLRSVELRQPEPEWAREIFDQCTFVEPRSTWQHWFWPSPLAWAALVVAWFGLAIANHADEPSAKPSPLAGTPSLILFAQHAQDSSSFWPLAATLPQ